MNNRGFVISHTHWDRAWYLPFQAYRLRLVRMIDDLLELLESDDSFKCFTLDGQTVLLEDYLEIRPQNLVRLQKLVQASRLFIGPWYTLPDLFIPCGESVIRNLQLGLNIAREFGEPMKIGYLPDPFGHFAQLPQILQGFDISSFI
ncbi:MAG: glycoside hydrolase, partial [Candidatus Rifleibacteriota bacterium]